MPDLHVSLELFAAVIAEERTVHVGGAAMGAVLLLRRVFEAPAAGRAENSPRRNVFVTPWTLCHDEKMVAAGLAELRISGNRILAFGAFYRVV